MPVVALVGLGSMGMGMGLRLLDRGFEVRGVDVDEAKRDAFAKGGGLGCGTVGEACADSDFVITMLPRDEHVREVLTGPGGVLASARRGTMVVEMSTISPATSLLIGSRLREVGLRMIDAPVGRTPADARAGTLLVLAGGDRDDVERARPVLEALGDKIMHLGPPGAGIRMKVINNYMSMVGMALTAETLVLARKAGIDLQVAAEVIRNTVAGRGQINVNFPRKVLAGDVTPDFPIELGRKDLSLALNLGQELGVPLFLGGGAGGLFDVARAGGFAGLDCTALLLAMERLAGMEPSLSSGKKERGDERTP